MKNYIGWNLRKFIPANLSPFMVCDMTDGPRAPGTFLSIKLIITIKYWADIVCTDEPNIHTITDAKHNLTSYY